jgi:hypothetical protein
MKLERMPRKAKKVSRGALYHPDPDVAALEQLLDQFCELEGAVFTFSLELDVWVERLRVPPASATSAVKDHGL